MGFNKHMGTMGHKIGASIIGKDLGKPNQADEDGQSEGKSGFSRMSIMPSHNGGFSVNHSPMSTKAESPAEEQMHVFKSASEAHAHIGRLLGIGAGIEG